MVNEAMVRALQFLRNHKDVALATSEGDIPKLRIFQVMKQKGNVSVRCSGMVNFNVEDDTKRWIYEHNDVLRRLYASYDQMVYFCLPIAEMDYYDLQPTPFQGYQPAIDYCKEHGYKWY